MRGIGGRDCHGVGHWWIARIKVAAFTECQRADTDSAAMCFHPGAAGWWPHHFGIFNTLRDVQQPLVSLCAAESPVGVLKVQD